MLPPSDTDNIRKVVDSIGVFEVIKNKKGVKDSLYKNIQDIEVFINMAKNMQREKENQDEILSDISLKYNLVSAVLSAKAGNKGMDMFRQTLNNEFLEFSNSDNSLANEAQIFLQLQNIEKELSIIASCRNLYEKNIVAIGGGFSAGKSEFISSFIKSKIRLPVSIEPTTAIPTYVMNSNKEQIIGYNKLGGTVDLKAIDENFHLKLSHNFIQGFKFNLKDILPFLVMTTKLKFKNICFVDTPGYNPSGIIENYNKDIDTAKEFLEEASSFIWIVSVDANGTMPSGDLEFLSGLNLECKKLYVVLSKADLRSKIDLMSIIEVVKESLDDYGIVYEGIQTFSSITAHDDFCVVGKKLDQFLQECNTPNKKHIEIINKLKDVYQAYKIAILNRIEEKKSIQKALKTISLDMLEGGLDDMSGKAHARVGELASNFDTKKEDENLKLLDLAMDKFKEAVKIVFEIDDVGVDFNDGLIAKEKKVTKTNSIKQNAKKEISNKIDNNIKKSQDNENNKKSEYQKLANIIPKGKVLNSYEIIKSLSKNNDKAIFEFVADISERPNLNEKELKIHYKAISNYYGGFSYYEPLFKALDDIKQHIEDIRIEIEKTLGKQALDKFKKNTSLGLKKFRLFAISPCCYSCGKTSKVVKYAKGATGILSQMISIANAEKRDISTLTNNDIAKAGSSIDFYCDKCNEWFSGSFCSRDYSL